MYHLLSPRKVQKRLRLAVHCLGSAPTGLTAGVGRDRKSAAVGLGKCRHKLGSENGLSTSEFILICMP